MRAFVVFLTAVAAAGQGKSFATEWHSHSHPSPSEGHSHSPPHRLKGILIPPPALPAALRLSSKPDAILSCQGGGDFDVQAGTELSVEQVVSVTFVFKPANLWQGPQAQLQNLTPSAYKLNLTVSFKLCILAGPVASHQGAFSLLYVLGDLCV